MIWLIVGIFAVAAMLLHPYGRRLLGVAILLLVGCGVLFWGAATIGQHNFAAQQKEADARYPGTSVVPAPLDIRPVETRPTAAAPPTPPAQPERYLTDAEAGVSSPPPTPSTESDPER